MDKDLDDPTHHWYRISVGEGFFAYKNVITGYALDHFHDQSIEALDDDIKYHHHQWQEIEVGEGYFALKNRGSGKVLDHLLECYLRAFNGDTCHVNHQWKRIFLTDEEEDQAPHAEPNPLEEEAIQEWKMIPEPTQAAGVVMLRNRMPSKVLCQIENSAVEAYDEVTDTPTHQWYRIPIGIPTLRSETSSLGRIWIIFTSTRSKRCTGTVITIITNGKRSTWEMDLSL